MASTPSSLGSPRKNIKKRENKKKKVKEACQNTIFLAVGKRKQGGGGHWSWSSRTKRIDCSSSGLWRKETEQSFPGLIDGCLLFFICEQEWELGPSKQGTLRRSTAGWKDRVEMGDWAFADCEVAWTPWLVTIRLEAGFYTERGLLFACHCCLPMCSAT